MGPVVAGFKALLVAVQESSQLSVHFTRVKHTIDSSSRHLLLCLALTDVWSPQLTVPYELRAQSGGRDTRARGSQSVPGATALPEWDPRVTLNLFKEGSGFGSPAGQWEGCWLRNPCWLTATQRHAQAHSQLLMTLVPLTPCQQAVGQIRLSVKVRSWMTDKDCKKIQLHISLDRQIENSHLSMQDRANFWAFKTSCFNYSGQIFGVLPLLCRDVSELKSQYDKALLTSPQSDMYYYI